MGDLFANNGQTLLGGKSESSGNLAYPGLSGPLSGIVGNGAGASSQIANMLGLNGTAAQGQGFDNWKNSTGYQFGKQQGMDAIVGNAATNGILNSGDTIKAAQTFGQNYADTQYGSYMNQLQGLLGSGISGANALAGAGQVSQGSSQPGIMGSLGQLLGKKGSG